MALTSLYNQLGKYIDAKPIDESGTEPTLVQLFARARHVADKKRKDESALVVELLEQTGAVLVSSGKRAEGAIILSFTMSFASGILGPAHASTDRIIRSLTAVYEKLGFPTFAAPLYELLLYQTEKEFGPKDPETLEWVTALARYNYSLSAYERAEGYYERLLEVLAKDKPSLQRGLRATEYGHVLTCLNKEEEAEKWYELAVADLRGRGTLPDIVAITHFQITSRLSRFVGTKKGQTYAQNAYERLVALEPSVPSDRWKRLVSQLKELANV